MPLPLPAFDPIRMPPITQLKFGDRADGYYYLADVQPKPDKKMATATLTDTSGSIRVSIFRYDPTESATLLALTPAIVYLEGAVVDEFQGETRIKLRENRSPGSIFLLEPADVTDALRERFTPASAVPVIPLRRLLDGFIQEIRHPLYHRIVSLLIGKGGQYRDAFLACPAAVLRHHAYRHGLLEHTVDVTRRALALADVDHRTDFCLLIAASLLHDIGKVLEHQPDETGIGFQQSDEGKKLQHLLLGFRLIEQIAPFVGPEFPILSPGQDKEDYDLLLHCVAAHHGKKEWGSPVEPGCREAHYLHVADHVSSTLADLDTDNDEVMRSGVKGEHWAWSQRFRRPMRYTPVPPANGAPVAVDGVAKGVESRVPAGVAEEDN